MAGGGGRGSSLRPLMGSDGDSLEDHQQGVTIRFGADGLFAS